MPPLAHEQFTLESGGVMRRLCPGSPRSYSLPSSSSLPKVLSSIATYRVSFQAPLSRISRPNLFGFAKNALRSARQFVDEYLRNLAELPAPKHPDRQARKAAQRQHAQSGIALQVRRLHRKAGAESISHVDGHRILRARLHRCPPNDVPADHFLLK